MYLNPRCPNPVLLPGPCRPSGCQSGLLQPGSQRSYSAQDKSEEGPALSRGKGHSGFLCPHSPMVIPEIKVPGSARPVMRRGTGWTVDSPTFLEACGKGGQRCPWVRGASH